MASSSRRGQGTALTHLRGILLVLPWLTWLLAANLTLSLLLPLKPFFPDAVYRLSSSIAFSVWRWVQAIFERANGARIAMSGDALPKGESAVVVSNHVAWADFYMIQALALRSGMLGFCRYFAKIQLRVVPFLGWGLWALGTPMVSRQWEQDRRQMDRVFHGVVARRWPMWLISFSEGTRFTPAKLAESATWCAANGRPQPRNLLYPRTKGFVATVGRLRRAPHVKAVYDFTIAYQDPRGRWGVAPSMWDTLSMPALGGAAAGTATSTAGFKFHVHARRFPIEELPHDEEELVKWLELRWLEKGEWLEARKLEWAAETTK